MLTKNEQSTTFANRDARHCRTLRFAGLVAVVVWAAIVGAGMERLWRYKNTPGAAAETVKQWPGSALVSPQQGRATLVMFVHPRCSCSRASLAELRNIMERAQRPVSAWVLLIHPKGAPQDWQGTETSETAQHIPNVTVLTDHDGIEAARFGAATSGQVVLYDADGRLLFDGGITGSRGHVGDNSGERRVLSLLNTGSADGHDHAVFGCGLHDSHPVEM